MLFVFQSNSFIWSDNMVRFAIKRQDSCWRLFWVFEIIFVYSSLLKKLPNETGHNIQWCFFVSSAASRGAQAISDEFQWVMKLSNELIPEKVQFSRLLFVGNKSPAQIFRPYPLRVSNWIQREIKTSVLLDGSSNSTEVFAGKCQKNRLFLPKLQVQRNLVHRWNQNRPPLN